MCYINNKEKGSCDIELATRLVRIWILKNIIKILTW